MGPERKPKMMNALHKRQANLAVVLENIEDPHNIAAVLRTCDAVGIQDVYTINTATPLPKKWGFRSSRSAYKWVSVFQFSNIEACIKVLRENYQCLLAAHLNPTANSLYELNLTQSIALLFGNEKHGLSNALLTHSDGSFFIPQMGMIQSLNISVACGVTIYEALRQRQLAGLYQTPTLSQERMDSLLYEWEFKQQ